MCSITFPYAVAAPAGDKESGGRGTDAPRLAGQLWVCMVCITQCSPEKLPSAFSTKQSPCARAQHCFPEPCRVSGSRLLSPRRHAGSSGRCSARSDLGKPVPWPLALHRQQPLQITRSPSASLLLNCCLFTRGILNSSSNLNKKVSLLFVSSLSRAATFKWFSSSPFISECTRREGIGSLLIKNKRWWHYNQCRVVIITVYLHFHRALALGCLWYKAAVLCALIEWNYFINTHSLNPRKDPFRGEDMGRVVGRWGARWAQFLADQFCLRERFLCSLQNCLSSTSGYRGFFFPTSQMNDLTTHVQSCDSLLLAWITSHLWPPLVRSRLQVYTRHWRENIPSSFLPGPVCWLFMSDNLTVWLGHSNNLLVPTQGRNLPSTHHGALICLMRLYSCAHPKPTPLIGRATLCSWLVKQHPSFQALCAHTLESLLVIYCVPG